MSNRPELLLIDEYADYVRIPLATARYWHATGYGPQPVRIGRRLMYRRADVDRWLTEKFAAGAGDGK